ncbi:gephyrin-like [Camponotus floridanus]|uniref:gephyrin-like n=1 Tax=Camponotus floridanus TaxID=104421 RepID=UPI00059DCBF0|nr:gephyrin-like [Camponotus floridanus]XP_025270905.1 gephyrin-like [Camponotus floridanus]
MEELRQDVGDNSSPSSESTTTATAEELEEWLRAQYNLVTVAQALSKLEEIINNRPDRTTSEVIKIDDAYGRILAEAQTSNCDLPAVRVATKHGYAVLARDGESRRRIIKTSSSDPVSLLSGTCMYMKSGQRVPDEATAVVQMKDVERLIPYRNIILIKINPEIGQNIKDIGSDLSKEKQIVPQFTRIGAAELILLAATGRKEVPVVKPVSVGIFSIGEFLVKPGEPLSPGQVYDSAKISLTALLKDKGFNSIVDFGIVTEDIQLIKMKIEDALKQVDVLVTIGCSNDYDLLKPILVNNFEATIHFENIFIKPGKSTVFATCELEGKQKYLLCLSRNPVTVLVVAHIFLLTLLKGLCNMFQKPCIIPAYVKEEYLLHSRPRAAWATLEWNEWENFARASSRENLDSDKLSSCQGANALVLFPSRAWSDKMSNTYLCASPIK